MLCAGVSFLSFGDSASFGNFLTGAASTLEERKTMRPYLSNDSVIWITLS
jgi:hypothetical protein